MRKSARERSGASHDKALAAQRPARRDPQPGDEGALARGRAHAPGLPYLVSECEKHLPSAIRCFLDEFEACIADLRSRLPTGA